MKLIDAFYTNGIYFSLLALSVQSSGGDSWTKQVSYTGSEPNSEVVQCSCLLKPPPTFHHLQCLPAVKIFHFSCLPPC